MRSAVFLSLFFSSFGVTAEEEKGQSLPGDAGWKNIPPFFFFFFFLRNQATNFGSAGPIRRHWGHNKRRTS